MSTGEKHCLDGWIYILFQYDAHRPFVPQSLLMNAVVGLAFFRNSDAHIRRRWLHLVSWDCLMQIMRVRGAE